MAMARSTSGTISSEGLRDHERCRAIAIFVTIRWALAVCVLLVGIVTPLATHADDAPAREKSAAEDEQEPPSGSSDALDPLRDAAEPCAPDIRHCFGLHIHVGRSHDGSPVVSPEWARRQIATANRHFGPADVGFEIDSVDPLDDGQQTVHSRTDRDQLGRDRYTRGPIHVFFVEQLDNVDADGEIRGVHWRDRDDRSHRWVIVSAISTDSVLAHELGHFFGLGHSEYAISIMNKSRRAEPPFDERTFHDDEIETIAKRRDRMIDSERLTNRASATPASPDGSSDGARTDSDDASAD